MKWKASAARDAGLGTPLLVAVDQEGGRVARFGAPEDLLGAVYWLLSPASAFVTGIVLPIDGGFAAYSGV